jgi:hypothetical protein
MRIYPMKPYKLLDRGSLGPKSREKVDLKTATRERHTAANKNKPKGV